MTGREREGEDAPPHTSSSFQLFLLPLYFHLPLLMETSHLAPCLSPVPFSRYHSPAQSSHFRTAWSPLSGGRLLPTAHKEKVRKLQAVDKALTESLLYTGPSSHANEHARVIGASAARVLCTGNVYSEKPCPRHWFLMRCHSGDKCTVVL